MSTTSANGLASLRTNDPAPGAARSAGMKPLVAWSTGSTSVPAPARARRSG